tara:strand:- start:150 stop:1205 length:1056 start_codon:yes stop_codon:yes gene_type:complete
MRYLSLVLAVLLYSTNFAEQESQVLLKNGNSITIKGLHFLSGKINASYYEGNLEIPWNEVIGIELSQQHVVNLKDGSRLVGRSKGSPESGYFLSFVIQDGRRVALKKSEIEEIKTLYRWRLEEREKTQSRRHKFRRTWKGSADAGLIVQQGNTDDTQFNLALRTRRTSEFDVFHINLLATQGETSGRENANSAKIQTRFDLKHQKDLYYFLLSSLEYDKIKKIDLRSVLGLGFGWTYFDTPKRKLQFSFGLNSDKESREDNTRRSLVTALLATDFKFPIFGDNHLTGAVHIYPDLKELGDNMRADSIVSYVAPMTKDTNLKLSLTNKYQQTVLPGVEKLDTRFTTSLGYEF